MANSKKAAKAKRKIHKWELKYCARHGHTTFEPLGDDPETAELRRGLSSVNGHGEIAWRCLVCGVYELAPAKFRGLPQNAPVVRRGKELRAAFIERFLGTERLVRAAIMFGLLYGIYMLHQDQAALQGWLNAHLDAFQQFGYSVDSNFLLKSIHKGATVSGHTLKLAAIVIGLYGLVEAVEGVGLILMKRWGEYVAVVATSAFFIPEGMELAHHLTTTKLIAILLNALAVAYLIFSKHLFKVRGGKETYETKNKDEAIIEVRAAAKSA